MADRAEGYSVTFTGVSGPVWVIAHSVVCDTSGTNMVSVYPNPFRNFMNSSISLENDTRAVVEVYTLQGAKVAVLFDEPVSAEDDHTVAFTPDVYTSRQIYLVVVRTDQGRTTRQVLTY